MSATLCDGSSRPVPLKSRYLMGRRTYLKNLNSRKSSALLSLFYVVSWLASFKFQNYKYEDFKCIRDIERNSFSGKLVNGRNFRETGPWHRIILSLYHKSGFQQFRFDFALKRMGGYNLKNLAPFCQPYRTNAHNQSTR